MNNKAQSSFEALIITVIIFSVTIYVLTVYLNLNDSIIALGMLKTETIEKLNAENKFYFLEKIDFQENPATNEITFNLTTKPNDLTSLGLQEIGTKIKEKTKYEKVIINLNGNQVYNSG